MIIVAGSVQIKSGMREKATQAALEMARATQTEAGCITYKFYGDLEDPHTFFIFEAWQSEADLAKHFETPHMATFRQQLPEFVAGPMSIKKYEVGKVEDI